MNVKVDKAWCDVVAAGVDALGVGQPAIGRQESGDLPAIDEQAAAADGVVQDELRVVKMKGGHGKRERNERGFPAVSRHDVVETRQAKPVQSIKSDEV